MDLTDRREFLKRCIASVPTLAFANNLDGERTLDAENNQSGGSTQAAFRTPATLERYIDPLPIPKRILPYATQNGIFKYRVRMTEFKKPLHSQLPPTRLWGYEGRYPGPTFEAVQGRPVEVRWQNHLPAAHIFAIDPHIHGAMPPTPPVRTVPHLHGARSRSESDGLPEKWFTPGKSALYHYPNGQPAATLWYHDHAVGITRLNVYAGLSGLFFCATKSNAASICLQGIMRFRSSCRTAHWMTTGSLSILRRRTMPWHFPAECGDQCSSASFQS